MSSLPSCHCKNLIPTRCLCRPRAVVTPNSSGCLGRPQKWDAQSLNLPFFFLSRANVRVSRQSGFSHSFLLPYNLHLCKQKNTARKGKLQILTVCVARSPGEFVGRKSGVFCSHVSKTGCLGPCWSWPGGDGRDGHLPGTLPVSSCLQAAAGFPCYSSERKA